MCARVCIGGLQIQKRAHAIVIPNTAVAVTMKQLIIGEFISVIY